MNNETENAKRALLGLGKYEMNDEGVLLKIEAGRDGIIHIPKDCKAFLVNHLGTNATCSVFEWAEFNGGNDFNGICFCSDNEILIDKAVCKPTAFKVYEKLPLILDLRNNVENISSALYLLHHFVNDLRLGVEIKYLFNGADFPMQVAQVVNVMGLNGGSGLSFRGNPGNVRILLGVTDITEKFCEPKNLKIIILTLKNKSDGKFFSDLFGVLTAYGFAPKWQELLKWMVDTNTK